MATNFQCVECPYPHPAGEDCPPGWHDVRAEGGDGGGGFPWGGLLWFTPLLVLAAIALSLVLVRP